MSVIDKDKHARLLQDLDHICETANITKAMIYRSATEFLQPVELDWLQNFYAYRDAGENLLLVGKHTPGPDTKMMAIAAALLRNFIDARVIPLNTLISACEKGDPPDPTVLLIPNLYVWSEGKALPAWKIQSVYDLLLQRLTMGKPVVAYVEELAPMEKSYGQVFAQHLADHYRRSEAHA